MESSLPEWVTKEFFEQCLRKEEDNDNIVVQNLTVSSAAPPGNNYGSFIIRVELEWKVHKDASELKSSKFIVKADHTEGPMVAFMADFTHNEPSFYYNFIPKAKQFGDINFAANSFFSPNSNVTILEDLKEKGFVMADRTKQLDFDHCRLYMIAAASFHAVSIPVYKDYPELLEPIKNEMMFSNVSKSANLFQNMINSGAKKFAKEISKIDRFKKYTDLVNYLTPHLWEMLVEVHMQGKLSCVKTIKQGDPWVTNMMFKYDKDNKVCDIKIIDFQATGYGSPVTDLMFFLWSSASIEVKKNRMCDLFRIYVESFNENLKKFNSDENVTFDQVMADVEMLKPLALFVSCSSLPCLMHTEPIDVAEMFSTDSDMGDILSIYYTEDYCKNFLPQVVETLEINGVFSSLENYKK